MRRRVAGLLTAGLMGAACSGASGQHGSPILLQVLWSASGVAALVWTATPDPKLAAQVPAAAQEVDFVFDRRLDGDRIEDTATVNGSVTAVPKADPPITASWADLSTRMSDPPFADQVLYNSEPFYGGMTAYVLLRPATVGFPSADTVSFSLDKTGLTSAYGDQMTGPEQIDVATAPFMATFKLPADADGATSVPSNFMLPVVFSNRTAPIAALAPHVQVTAGGRTLPVTLASSASDPTLLYLSAASCLGGWPSDAPIVVTLLAGLPDAFGATLAAPASATFTASATGALPAPDGGCGSADAGPD
jgi:hypothetical protein